ncbi:hypothetical protein LIER_28353 [Lithospermum erythrorhizon]|uniref:F-box protein n=1 Tax=Lithospermum erythrorhizon TaxID=34254 RepID=A0AAV3RFD9_LITER
MSGGDDCEWLGRSHVLVLARLEMKSMLFIFDLQHNKIIEENIGGISWNMSDTLVVRGTSIYSIGFDMYPESFRDILAGYKDPKGVYDQGDVDFFHSGASVLDLGAKNKKWKHLADRRKMMRRPSSAILGHNIYAFSGTRALVYHINTNKWENLIRPPELLELRKSMIASYGRPLLPPEWDKIVDPRTIRHPVISDTLNNRLLVNFWYALYAYYPQESKWECLLDNKSSPCFCFHRTAQLFDHIVYFFCPGTPYCIYAYDVTTNKPVKVSWSEDFPADFYNELLHFGSDVCNRWYDVKLVHLGDGMMCLACGSSRDHKSSTCFRFLRFKVEPCAEGGLRICFLSFAAAHLYHLAGCQYVGADQGCGYRDG